MADTYTFLSEWQKSIKMRMWSFRLLSKVRMLCTSTNDPEQLQDKAHPGLAEWSWSLPIKHA